MNRHKITGGIAALALIVGVGACDSGLTELNENPNDPTEVPAELLFGQAIQSSVELVFGMGLNGNIASTWSQQFGQFQYPDEDRFRLRTGSVDNYWSSFYSSSLRDLETIIASGTAAERPNYVGVAQIMRAWEFGIMTDLWGDIPYTEALVDPAAEEPTFEPVYDKQSAIYPAVLDELEAAVVMLNAAEPAITDQDLLYGGDLDAWRKFANSLRLRMGMRMSEVDPEAAEAEVAAAFAAGVFESNDDNAFLSYEGAARPNENPLFENHRSRDDHAISKTMVDMLLDLADPRLAIYADPIPADTVEDDGWTYIGRQNGSSAGAVADSISRIGHIWREEPDAPLVLMSYSEVLFLQAEAADRGWISGDPEALYEAAIRASMEQYEIDGDEIDAYLAQPEVAYNGRESIAVQKWISLYINGVEAYAEWRRTGYPVLVPGPDHVNTIDAIPVRLPYSSDEGTLNGANLNAAVSAQGMVGPGDYNVPVWWDVN